MKMVYSRGLLYRIISMVNLEIYRTKTIKIYHLLLLKLKFKQCIEQNEYKQLAVYTRRNG